MRLYEILAEWVVRPVPKSKIQLKCNYKLRGSITIYHSVNCPCTDNPEYRMLFGRLLKRNKVFKCIIYLFAAKVQETFPQETAVSVRANIRQKLNNSVKIMKSRAARANTNVAA